MSRFLLYFERIGCHLIKWLHWTAISHYNTPLNGTWVINGFNLSGQNWCKHFILFLTTELMNSNGASVKKKIFKLPPFTKFTSFFHYPSFGIEIHSMFINFINLIYGAKSFAQNVKWNVLELVFYILLSRNGSSCTSHLFRIFKNFLLF